MISITELRHGATFQDNGRPLVVLEYKHTKLGRGKANIRVKVKDLLTGSVLEKSFISGARVEPIQTAKRPMQYLYQEGENLVFMDPKNFEQATIAAKLLGEQAKFLVEGQEVSVLFWEEKPLLVELPVSLVLKIKETGPGVKGDTAARSFKPATLENGAVVKVPLFLKPGDKVKVDTRTGEYLERIGG
jgi:elongation factor P